VTPDAVAIPTPRVSRGSFIAWRRQVAMLPLYAFFSCFVAYPMALILVESLSGKRGVSLAAYARFAATPYYVQAVFNTLLIATLSTVLATVLGIYLAFMFTFVSFRGRQVFNSLFSLMIVFPTFLIAFALILVYGSSGIFNLGWLGMFHRSLFDFVYTWKGVVLADVIVFTPFVMQPVMASMRLVDPGVLEVAQTLGSTGSHTVRTVLLPIIRPGVFAGSSLCYLLALNEFGIVAFLGSTSVYTLPVIVYSEAFLNLNLAMSSAVAVISSTMSVGLFVVYRRLSGRVQLYTN